MVWRWTVVVVRWAVQGRVRTTEHGVSFVLLLDSIVLKAGQIGEWAMLCAHRQLIQKARVYLRIGRADWLLDHKANQMAMTSTKA